jgi:hypothetical protein
MGLLDELLKAQKPKRNLMGTQMVKGPDQPYLRQDYPTLYGALGGLLGTAPDEMAGSVMDPNTAAVRQGAEYGFPVGTALGVLPMAAPVQRGAMALGRAGEQFAERAVPQVMNRGGLLAEMLQGMSRGTVSPLDVYHGTPHRLPPTPRNPLGEFDASKIGTGEGAQSYGLGIYTAEARPVAEEYAKNLANADRMNQGRLTAHANAKRLAELTGDPKYAADDIRFVLESNPDHDQKKLLTETLNFLESGNYKKPLENKGNLYKVDLPDEKIAQMIDYDKPMAEQRNLIEKMREALVGPDSPLSRSEQFQINDYLSDSVRMRNLYPQSIVDLNDARIVERLRQVGIPGVKYLDEGSRAAGTTKQTRNFVTFPGEEKNLRILERNSQKASDLSTPPIDDEELRRLQSGLLYAP